jgi:hypothetical protein
LVVRSCPLHGVIYFSRRGLWHRLFAILPHHSFGFEEYWAIFCVVIGIIVVVHALWRLEWVLATDSSSTWHSSPMVVLVCSALKSPLTPHLRRWPKILFPVFWRPATIRIDAIDMLGVIVLFPIILVCWPWSFVMLGCFFCSSSLQKWRTSDLLNLAKFS